MAQIFIFAAVGIALATTPATAQVNASRANADKPAAVQNHKKYCLTYDATTGTRISKQECLTKKEWAERGIDLDEYLKK